MRALQCGASVPRWRHSVTGLSYKNPLLAGRGSYSTLTACVNAGAENGASTAESSQVRRCRADRQHFL